MANAARPSIFRSAVGSRAGAKKAQTCQRITGDARTTPAYRLTVSETVKGSATPRVARCRWPVGSGRASQARSHAWKLNATIVVVVSAPRMTKRRARNSSRCSASVVSSPCGRRRGSQLIVPLVVLALGRLRNERRRLGRSKLLGRARGVVTCDRVLELPHPISERAPDLRQPSAAEEQQRDHEDQDDVPRLCKSCHVEDGRPYRCASKGVRGSLGQPR